MCHKVLFMRQWGGAPENEHDIGQVICTVRGCQGLGSKAANSVIWDPYMA